MWADHVHAMKMKAATYGFRDNDIELARAEIQDILGLEFVGHESSYFGEYYAARTDQREPVSLMHNFNEMEQELDMPDYPDVPILLDLADIRSEERFAELRMMLEASDRIRLLIEKEY